MSHVLLPNDVFHIKMSEIEQSRNSGPSNISRSQSGIRLMGAVLASFLVILLALRLVDGLLRNVGLLMVQNRIEVVDLASDWGADSLDLEGLETAEKLIDTSIRQGGQANTPWLALGLIDSLRERDDSAIQRWENIDSRRILYAVGQYRESQGDWDQALHLYQSSLDEEDKKLGSSSILYRIGFVKMFRLSPADSDGAFEAFQTAVDLDDYTEREYQQAHAHFLLGRIYLERLLYEDAVREFQHAIEMGEDSYQVYSQLTDALWAVDRKAEAIETVKRAISADPTQIRAYRRLAKFYQAEKRIEEAIAAFEIVLEIDPDDVTAIQALKNLNAR